MPFPCPTLQSVTPTVDDVFKIVRGYKPEKDGDWQQYLLSTTVYLVKENLKSAIKDAIYAELNSYIALYGTVDESDDIEDYWNGFDDELLTLFSSVIEHIGRDVYDGIVPGHDVNDAHTVWTMCDEIAEAISNAWPTIEDTLITTAGIDRIQMKMDGPKALVFLDYPLQSETLVPEVPVAPEPPKVVGVPKLINGNAAAPSLSAIKGQPNSQLLAEVFTILRTKISDNEYAEMGLMSRSTFLNYATGKSAARLRVDQAASLRHGLDKQLEKLQRAINILATVTRDMP